MALSDGLAFLAADALGVFADPAWKGAGIKVVEVIKGGPLDKAGVAVKPGMVIEAIDGPIALTACVEGAGSACEVLHHCPMRGRWDPVNAAIREALGAITLADMQTSAAQLRLRPAPIGYTPSPIE